MMPFETDMSFATRSCMGIGFAFLACFGPGVHTSEAQTARIEGFFPRQLPRGQSTVVSVAVPSRDTVQAAEISPAAGVKVSGITRGQNIQGALTWAEVTIEVAADAAPGDRALVLLLPMGRTAPATITIPTHAPSISALRLVAAPANQSPLELQFTAADASGDLGESPYVWFTMSCGRDRFAGVVYGKANGPAVRASIPRALAKGQCDLRMRVTDSGGIESNTLTIDVTN